MNLEKMNVVNIPIEKITVDGNNPNQMSPEQLASLEKSIRKFGSIVPVIVNKKNVVADGEHRLRVYRKLGLKTVPVIKLDVDDVDRRILRQVMNKLHGEHDLQADAQEFERIIAEGRSESLTGLLAQQKSDIQEVIDRGNELTALEASGCERPDFTDIIDKFSGKEGSEKNENWFYVEFYRDDKRFAELIELLKEHMKNKSKHEIDGEFFARMVNKYLNGKK